MPTAPLDPALPDPIAAPVTPESIAATDALIIDILRHRVGKDERAAKPHDWFTATVLTIRDRIIDRWMESTRETYASGGKRVYYLSLEFLIGRLLRDALSNMGLTREIAAWAAPHLAPDASVIAAASSLMHAVHDEFTYDSKATKADTPPLEAFRAKRGVCQDFAHVMIIALRHAGIPAAYVSGYLRTNPPPGKARLVGADATHAWANVWCGAGLGWVGFDPTNAMLAGNDHIFTAMGRDFSDVSPLDGVFIGGGGQRMKVSVEVTPLDS